MSKNDVKEGDEVVEESVEDTSEEEVVEASEADGEVGEGAEEPDADVYKDRWVRLAAEFDNYKKRTLRERDALIQSANEGLIRDLLPVVDSVDRATAHAEGDTDSEAFKEGVRMIMEEMPRILENRGLKEIEAAGQTFDPNLHEALMQVPSEQEAGTIADVIERGYCLGDRVIRPAKVVVSQGPADVSQESNDNSEEAAEDSSDAADEKEENA
jgi:molecular chaperone GrpE